MGMRKRIAGGVAILVGLGMIASGFRHGWTVNFIARLSVGLIVFLPGLYYLLAGRDRG